MSVLACHARRMILFLSRNLDTVHVRHDITSRHSGPQGEKSSIFQTQEQANSQFLSKFINFYFTSIHFSQNFHKNLQFLHFFNFKKLKFHQKLQKFSQKSVFTSCHPQKILLYFILSKFSSILQKTGKIMANKTLSGAEDFRLSRWIGHSDVRCHPRLQHQSCAQPS